MYFFGYEELSVTRVPIILINYLNNRKSSNQSELNKNKVKLNFLFNGKNKRPKPGFH